MPLPIHGASEDKTCCNVVKVNGTVVKCEGAAGMDTGSVRNMFDSYRISATCMVRKNGQRQT